MSIREHIYPSLNKYLRKYIFPSLNNKSKVNILTPFAEEEQIPKIIHQIYFSADNKSLPQAIQENINKIKVMNPDWEHRFYDDADIVDFIKNNYDSRILDYFNRINPKYGAAKADLFRYLLMYKCGGIYIDIKSSVNKPLNNIYNANDRYLLSSWRNKKGDQFAGWGLYPDLKSVANGEYQQWHIVASPGHPFLKAVIENVLSNIDNYIPTLHDVGKVGVVRVTGPIAYTLAIAPLLHIHKHRFVDSQFDMGFGYSIFSSAIDHNSIFKNHYSDLSESIIKIKGTKKILALVFNILKKTRDILFPEM